MMVVFDLSSVLCFFCRASARVRQWETMMSSMFEGGSWEKMDEVYSFFSWSSTNSREPLYPKTV